MRSDGSSYFSRQLDWLHLAVIDGTGILEVLWNRQVHRRRTVSYMPALDDQGVAALGPDGKPTSWTEQNDIVDITTKDYPELTPVPLKEFYLLPGEARSIEDAVGVARVLWLYEDQLDRMVRAGTLDASEVERARPSSLPWTVLAGSALVAFAYAKYKPNPQFFNGKAVILAGGSRGLGLALARQLRAEGAS